MLLHCDFYQVLQMLKVKEFNWAWVDGKSVYDSLKIVKYLIV